MGQLVPILVVAAALYLGVGCVFALAFVTLGASRIDHSARVAPVSFRLLILPGCAALWPLLLRRWLFTSAPPPIDHPARARIERTRAVLLGPAAYWGMVVLVWFILVSAARFGAAP